MPEFLIDYKLENVCTGYCKNTYVVRDSNKERRRTNEQLLQAHLIYKRVEITNSNDNPLLPHCCCAFEAPWPAFVKPSLIGREKDEEALEKEWAKKKRKLNCNPLLMFGEDIKTNYEIVCKYVNVPRPMTILELMRFAEAAKYLNIVKSRNLKVKSIMSDKMIKRIYKTEYQELKDALFSYLLDDSFEWRSLRDYPGYRLERSRFKKIKDTRNAIKSALKSAIVDQALDELIISQVVVDLAAVLTRVKDANESNEFNLRPGLHDVEYDKYFEDYEDYLYSPDVDCKLLSQFTQRITLYLSEMKSVLATLYEKLVYDNMKVNYPSFKRISDYRDTYEKVLMVNCKK